MSSKQKTKSKRKIILILLAIVLLALLAIPAYIWLNFYMQTSTVFKQEIEDIVTTIGTTGRITLKTIGKSFYCYFVAPFRGEEEIEKCGWKNPWENVEAVEYEEVHQERYGVFLEPLNVPTGYLIFHPDTAFYPDWFANVRVSVSFPYFPEVKELYEVVQDSLKTFLLKPYEPIRTINVHATICKDEADIENPPADSIAWEICTSENSDLELEYEPKEYAAKKGSFIVSLMFPGSKLQTLYQNLKNKYGEDNIAKYYLDRVHLTINYSAVEITDYHILLVKKSLYELSQLQEMSIWDYLKLPIENYLYSRWIGDPGYYIAIGTEGEPVPVIIDPSKNREVNISFYLAIKKNDPEVHLDKDSNVYLFLLLPEYVKVVSQAGNFKFEPLNKNWTYGRWNYTIWVLTSEKIEKPVSEAIYAINLGSTNLEYYTQVQEAIDTTTNQFVELVESMEKQGNIPGMGVTIQILPKYYDKIFAGADYADLYIRVVFVYGAKKKITLPIQYKKYEIEKE